MIVGRWTPGNPHEQTGMKPEAQALANAERHDTGASDKQATRKEDSSVEESSQMRE